MRRVFAVYFAVLLLLSGCSSGVLLTETEAQQGCILIDPGHGGMDGGTTAADGTLEKNINLSIGLVLRDLFQVCGFPVAMTRQSDVSIHDASSESTRGIKVSDMQNRLRLYQQAQTVISVHQNHFSVAKYSGTQVFYSGNHPDSSSLAAAVRQSVITLLQPENTRELKKATDGIYLLHHTDRPAILVECGFLSNPQERELLKDMAYQQKMAFAILGGYWTYINQE